MYVLLTNLINNAFRQNIEIQRTTGTCPGAADASIAVYYINLLNYFEKNKLFQFWQIADDNWQIRYWHKRDYNMSLATKVQIIFFSLTCIGYLGQSFGKFPCDDGLVIDHFQRCDGKKDCRDGSDERQCTACVGDAFHCNQTQECFPPKVICDGQKDCTSGSDELNCRYSWWETIIITIVPVLLGVYMLGFIMYLFCLKLSKQLKCAFQLLLKVFQEYHEFLWRNVSTKLIIAIRLRNDSKVRDYALVAVSTNNDLGNIAHDEENPADGNCDNSSPTDTELRPLINGGSTADLLRVVPQSSSPTMSNETDASEIEDVIAEDVDKNDPTLARWFNIPRSRRVFVNGNTNVGTKKCPIAPREFVRTLHQTRE